MPNSAEYYLQELWRKFVEDAVDYSWVRVLADSLVKSGPGTIHTVTFSQADAAPTAGSITIYDSLTEGGQTIFTHTFTTAVFQPTTITLDIPFTIGLYVGFATTADVSVTVTFK